VHITTTSRTLRKFIATLFAASPRNVGLSAMVMVSLSFTEGLGLLLLVPLLQLVGVDAQGVSDPGGIGAGLSRVLAWMGTQPTLGAVLAIYVGIVVGQSALQRWNTMLSAAVRQQTEAMLRMRLYRAIAGAQWLFLARSRMSDFAHVLTSELDRVGTAAHDLIDLSVVALVATAYIVVALYVSPEATALVLLCGGTLAVILRRRVTDSHQLGGEQSTSRAHLHRAVIEHLGSMKTAKSYGAVDRHDEVFGKLTEQVQKVNMRTIGGYARLRQETIVGSAVVLALIVYVSRQFLALPTTHLLVLLFLFARLMPRLTGLFERAQTLATVLPAFRAFDDLESRCLAAAEAPPVEAHPLAFEREIRFDRVSFCYGASLDAPALGQIDLAIPAGAMTGIVGPSGAGKSTLADLLLGLLVPTRGSVLIDEQPLESGRVSAWRGQIGYVNQDTFLFHDTVRANLLWAQPDASEDDLWHVLRLAAADEFVGRLPARLDTILGDRGVLVSGGERQRLALARALLRRPRLLILDEATNALDSENEARIQSAIDGLRYHMTIVVITHRLAAVRAADLIHVIDEGRLVESGGWSDLMARPDGRLRQLWMAQGVEPTTPSEPRLEPVSFVRL
jgi:ATP-binding cassette subfamily C protein